MKKIAMILCMSAVLFQSAFAGDDATVDTAAVKKAIARLMPNTTLDSISSTAIPGLFEVVMGPQVLYVSKDGKFLVEGNLYDLEKQKNLTEEKRAAGRLKAIKALDPDSLIIFSPKKVKHSLTVFTDIDCGYCRKLHRDIDKYLAKGIEIRYAAFPRAGLNSPSYTKAVNVWCADDRKAAITAAKAGDTIKSKPCDNPVKKEYEIGESIGVTGTPTLVMEDGNILPGYLPPDRLAAYLDSKK
jgi:thiol:disulfide interchange protein DsbC